MKRVAAIAVVVVLALVALIVFVDVASLFEQLAHVSTPTAAALSVLIGAVCTLLMVPTSPLNLFAGMRFGVIGGTLVTLAACQIGAMLAFQATRRVTFVQTWSRTKLQENQSLNALASALSGPQGKRLVFLTRLAPIFPFALLNYVFSLSKIDFWSFSVATLAGNAPACLLYAYAASTATTHGDDAGYQAYVGPILSVLSVFAISTYAKKIIDEAQAKQ
jgi:uncharacterized membrane protein YdjX (TVP38/TMEM64 family)